MGSPEGEDDDAYLTWFTQELKGMLLSNLMIDMVIDERLDIYSQINTNFVQLSCTANTTTRVSSSKGR